MFCRVLNGTEHNFTNVKVRENDRIYDCCSDCFFKKEIGKIEDGKAIMYETEAAIREVENKKKYKAARKKK